MNTRAILFVLGLIIGAIAVFLWKKAETDRLKTCPDDLQRCADQLQETRAQLQSTASVVAVGPTPDRLSVEPLVIHVGERPVVYWKSLDADHDLKIVFEAKDYPASANGEPPFAEGTNGTSQAIRCSGDTCFSFGLNKNVVALFAGGTSLPCGPDVPLPPHGQKPYEKCLGYKYSQTLDGKTVDGHIIIVKP